MESLQTDVVLWETSESFRILGHTSTQQKTGRDSVAEKLQQKKKKINNNTFSIPFLDGQQMLGNMRPGAESVLNNNHYGYDLQRMLNTFQDFSTVQFITSQQLFDKADSFFKRIEIWNLLALKIWKKQKPQRRLHYSQVMRSVYLTSNRKLNTI